MIAIPAPDESTCLQLPPPPLPVGRPQPLHAVEHIRKMRGGSQAHLMRASNGAFYVVKLKSNPQGTKVLANEMLGTRIGLLLGLPMPQVEIIHVDDVLIAHTPELRFGIAGSIVPPSSGLQLGSRYLDDPSNTQVFDYLPEQMAHRIYNQHDFCRVLVFDKWVGNADGRQAIFTKAPGQRSYRAQFIDQGYCFNACEWTFVNHAYHGVYGQNWVYHHVRGWESFEPTLSRVESIDQQDLWNCARDIPTEWYGDDSAALSRLIEELYQRKSSVRDLIVKFRDSKRMPFPNWQSTISPIGF
jgi:hypothetical protein